MNITHHLTKARGQSLFRSSMERRVNIHAKLKGRAVEVAVLHKLLIMGNLGFQARIYRCGVSPETVHIAATG